MSTATQKLQTTLIQFYSQPVAKVSIELFLSIGTVVFFAIFAIRPTLLTMSDLIKEIDDKKQLDQKLDQKVAALSTVQNVYTSLENRLVVLDQAIPSQPEFETVLKIIEKIASEQQLAISSIQVKEIPKTTTDNLPFNKKQRISLPISVTVIGDYQAIRDFVIAIINTRRALIVDSMIFSVNEERGIKKLQANITINMQYFGTKDESSK
jgi:Tfp pilus assembly protein PilO